MSVVFFRRARFDALSGLYASRESDAEDRRAPARTSVLPNRVVVLSALPFGAARMHRRPAGLIPRRISVHERDDQAASPQFRAARDRTRRICPRRRSTLYNRYRLERRRSEE